MSKAPHCVESVASKSSARPSHGRTSPEPGAKGARRPVDMPWTVVLTRDAELGS
jgi:hypothetical protein